MLSNTHSYRHTLSCIFSVMPSFYYLIFIHRYLCTHARPACPICWTTLAVRSLAEQSAAVRSKLSCKTNLIWRGLINKWDYVLKKTRLYTLNQIWSCFRNLWMFLLYLIWGLAVFFFSPALIYCESHRVWSLQKSIQSFIIRHTFQLDLTQVYQTPGPSDIRSIAANDHANVSLVSFEYQDQ